MLVIIGLISGGIMVGADLIRAAKIRSTVSQIDQFNTAANTFKGKFGFLPGDIPGSVALQYGLGARSPGGVTIGNGDGNGVIESWNGGTKFGTYEAQGETILFWLDLTDAGFLNSAGFNRTTQAAWTSGNLSATSTPTLDACFPRAKIGGWVVVYSVDGINYCGLEFISGIQTNGPAFGSPGLTPPDAAAIDSKIDDGYPQQGNVTAQVLYNTVSRWVAGGNIGYGLYYGDSPGSAVSASSLRCYNNAGNAASPMVYAVAGAGSSGLNCSLQIRTGF